MYIIDFLKNLTKKSNIGVLIWLVLNTALIAALFSSGFQNWEGVLLGLGIYLISLIIALSPIGEWVLRLQNGCKKMTRREDIERFEPIFREVYMKAKKANPELPDNIKMFISDSKEPNAFATGRKTICVTKGLLNYTDEQIKGVLAHEFGHLAHKDTDAILVVAVGNMVVSVIFVAIRIFANIFMGIGQFMTAVMGRSLGSVLASIFIAIGRAIADLILVLLMRMWTQIGVWLCMYSSRKNEFEADEYSFNCGYGDSLCQVLESFGNGGGANGLFAALASSHPNTDQRIAKLQELGSAYRRGVMSVTGESEGITAPSTTNTSKSNTTFL